MAWDLVIFDCDGVLVDSEPITARLFSAMLGEIGLPMGYDEALEQFTGKAMAAWVALIKGRLGRPIPPGFVSDFYTRLDAAFRRELQPVPGVISALHRIRLPVCVASNGTLAKMQTTLGLTGLLPRFEGRIFSAAAIGRGKPSPGLFLHAARRMGAAPARCAVIEDSLLGAQAGIAAGMHVFGYTRLSNPDALAAAGAQVFSDMDELPDLLQDSADPPS